MILTKEQKRQILSNIIQASMYLGMLLVFVLLLTIFKGKKEHGKHSDVGSGFSYSFNIDSSTIDVNWIYSIKENYNDHNRRKRYYYDMDLELIYNYFDQFSIDEIKILNENIIIKIPRYRCDTIIITNINFITNN